MKKPCARSVDNLNKRIPSSFIDCHFNEKLPWSKNDGLKILGYSMLVFCLFMGLLWLRDCYVEKQMLEEYRVYRDKPESLIEAISKGKRIV